MPTCPMCGGRVFEAHFCKKCGMPEPEKVEAKKSASSIRGAPGGQRMTMDRLMKARESMQRAKDNPEEKKEEGPRKLPERAPSTRASGQEAQVTAAPPGAPPSNEDIAAAMAAAAANPEQAPQPAKKRKASTAKPPEPEGFVPTKCPSCGGGLRSPPPKFCDHCGNKVPIIKAKKKGPGGRPVADEDLKLCRNCGTRMPVDRTMCPNCGTPQKSED